MMTDLVIHAQGQAPVVQNSAMWVSIAPRCFGPSVNDFPFKKTSRGHWPSEGHFGNFFLMNYDFKSY